MTCDRCHRPGQPLRVERARCTDCHRDPHVGGVHKAEAGRCERCHDLDGFRPSRFAPEDHAKTAYPLAGAHLAVACDACHRLPAGSPAGAAMPLRLAGRRCTDCHRDPHRGEVARFVGAAGCEACHRVESWKQVSFDHAQTQYALSGRHALATCEACHLRPQAAGPAVLRLTGLPAACEGCHRDPHAGQFARAGQTACERCHSTESMKPARFDHARDSAFRLDGAHARLACSACHRSASRPGGPAVVRYRPLPTKCSGCHRQDPTPAKEDRR